MKAHIVLERNEETLCAVFLSSIFTKSMGYTTIHAGNNSKCNIYPNNDYTFIGGTSKEFYCEIGAVNEVLHLSRIRHDLNAAGTKYFNFWLPKITARLNKYGPPEDVPLDKIQFKNAMTYFFI